ncbi:hypothetical protein ZONE111905_10660 [Zobellia nedashkovskayae]
MIKKMNRHPKNTKIFSVRPVRIDQYSYQVIMHIAEKTARFTKKPYRHA